ncbi:MAG: hypothetical protein P8170_12980 [Gemmatimonadota bacterium]
MQLTDRPDAEILSSEATTFWKRIFPTAWTVGVGALAVAVWLGLIGDPPAPDVVRVVILGGWATFSALFFHWLGRLQHVWRVGNELVVGDRERGVRVNLTEIRNVKESRMQRLKMVTLELDHATPLGRKITFIPRGAKTFWLPFADSEVAADLRARMERLARPDPTRALED